MIRKITTDKDVLKLKSKEFPLEVGANPKSLIQDLTDTANSRKNECVGLAANQVGSHLTVFVMKREDKEATGDKRHRFYPFVNPKIIARSGGIKVGLETCLSLPNERPTKIRRHKEIVLEYSDMKGGRVKNKFKGFYARVIQHEMDHFEGVVI